MIKNSYDIYKIIKSPNYVMDYKPADGRIHKPISYDLFNSMLPIERIHIDIYDKHMEIYKTKNMNYEYYENIRTTNKRGQAILNRFHELLLIKQAIALVDNINKNYR